MGDNHLLSWVIITVNSFSQFFLTGCEWVLITPMPNQRKAGLKLAGAYIDPEKDEALAAMARKLGYPDKAAFIRALYDTALKSQGLSDLPGTSEHKQAKKKDK